MKKNMKKIVACSLVAAMAAGLAACGSSSSSSSASTSASDTTSASAAASTESAADTASSTADASGSGSGTLRMSWWGGDSRHNATLAAIDEYEKANPGVTIDSEYGAWSGWQDKIATQLAGNSEADIMQINWNWIYQFSSDGTGFYDINNVSDTLAHPYS